MTVEITKDSNSLSPKKIKIKKVDLMETGSIDFFFGDSKILKFRRLSTVGNRKILSEEPLDRPSHESDTNNLKE